MQGRAETGSNPPENRLGRGGPGKQDLDRYSRHQGGFRRLADRQELQLWA